MVAATQLKRESWLDAARDVIGVADVTEARGIVGEAHSYLHDAWTASQEFTARLVRNRRQRCIPDTFNDILILYTPTQH